VYILLSVQLSQSIGQCRLVVLDVLA